MVETESPNKKVKTSRYIIPFIISYASLFIFIYIVLSFLQIDFVFIFVAVFLIYLFLQMGIHGLDSYCEFKASREDWKNPHPPKRGSCKNHFENPSLIKTIFVKIKGEVFEPIYLYASFFDFPIIKKGWNTAVNNPESNSNNDHDAIIVMAYSKHSREYFTIAGLDLILQFFIYKKINYRVYSCDNLETFKKILNNPNASSLWILGHGCRGGIRIGDEVVKYSDIVMQLSDDAKNKRYIYQLHCNSGCDPSLSDLISKGRGFANYQRQFPYSIRGYLANILKDEKWNTASSTISSSR